ncbi:DEAD/DEAH box helicase family protein [Viridibacillus arvi]|uniref:DEAD/DEAH box helicase family protein n=1 Tax=Viridibacillus arvi TaxID=263475 RepID=UPI003CFECE4D
MKHNLTSNNGDTDINTQQGSFASNDKNEKVYPPNFYWVSDQISELVLFNDTGVNNDVEVTAAINTLRHYNTKIDVDLTETYSDYKKHSKGVTNNIYRFSDLMNELIIQSKQGNFVFLPSQYESEYNYNQGYFDKGGKWYTYESFGNAKLKLVRSNLFCIDVDGAAIEPLQLLKLLKNISSNVAGIIPTPSNMFPDVDTGIRSFSYRLLFISSAFTSSTEEYGKVIETLKQYIWKYLIDNDEVEVDMRMPKEPDQRIRVGKGKFYVNCNPRCININSMVEYYDNYIASEKEVQKEVVSERVQVIKDEKDGINDYEYEEAFNVAEGLKKDFAHLVFSQIGRIDSNMKDWLRLTGAIANLCVRGILNINDVNEAYEMHTWDSSKSSKNVITNLYRKNKGKDKKELKTGVPTIIEFYENYGGIGDDLYDPEYVTKQTMRDVLLKHFEDAPGKTVDTHTIIDHLGTNIIFALGAGRHLLESPTGSGKTKSSFLLLQSKQYSSSQDVIAIMAVPNVTNVMQNKEDYTSYSDSFFFLCPSMLKKVKGKVEKMTRVDETEDVVEGEKKEKEERDESFAHQIKQAYKAGKRVFCTTYDSVKTILNLISHVAPFVSLDFLIIDEAHQLTTSYNYRGYACRSLIKIMGDANTVIGLSGTINACNPSLYTHLTIVNKDGGNAVPVKRFMIINNGKSVIKDLYKLIDGYINKRQFGQVLIFLQNIKQGTKLGVHLDKKGISNVVVNGDNKTVNKDVVTMLKNKYIHKKVIISTSVISDGINLENPDEKHATIIVSNSKSNIFDSGTIRQMANRYRNTYNDLVWLRSAITANPEDKEQERLDERKHRRRISNIDDTYAYLHGISNKMLANINEMSKDVQDNSQFVRDLIEKEYCLKKDKDGNLDIDTDGLYYNAYVKRVKDSATRLLTLENEVEELLGVDVTLHYGSVGELDEVDKEDIDKTIDEIVAKEKEEREEFIKNIKTMLPKSKYNRLIKDNIDEIIEGYDKAAELIYERNEFIVTIPEFYAKLILSNSYLDYDGMVCYLQSVNKKNKNMLYDAYDTTISLIQYDKYGAYSETHKIRKEIESALAREMKADLQRLHSSGIGLHGDIYYNGETDSVSYTTKGCEVLIDKAIESLEFEYPNSKVKEIYKKYYFNSKDKQLRIQQTDKRVVVYKPAPKTIASIYDTISYPVDIYLTNLVRFADKYVRNNSKINKQLSLIANQSVTDASYIQLKSFKDYIEKYM